MGERWECEVVSSWWSITTDTLLLDSFLTHSMTASLLNAYKSGVVTYEKNRRNYTGDRTRLQPQPEIKSGRSGQYGKSGD